MPTNSAKASAAIKTGPLLRRIVHFVYPGAKLLDCTGPLQVFADAAEYARGAGHYSTVIVSVEGGPVVTDAGVPLPTRAVSGLRLKSSDAVLVTGGIGVYAAAQDDRIVGWLRSRAPRVELVASTCTGAFLMGAAGLLDGRRAVTHWSRCDDLQERYPGARVEADPIYIEDGNVWTSAGVTAGIDLSLALVERDLGRSVAMEIARNLVVYSRRPGGQSQFSQRLQQQSADESDEFEQLHGWIEDHLASDLRVEQLADRCAMTPRTFHRLYTKQMGQTPARAVARLRIEAARRLLEETTNPVKEIARRCGFGGEEQLRRNFQRELGVSPSGYRESWASPKDSPG